METMTLNDATSHLSDKIKEALDIVAPIETKTIGKKPINLWNTAGTKVSLKQSNTLYKKYKKNPTPENNELYTTYKKKTGLTCGAGLCS